MNTPQRSSSHPGQDFKVVVLLSTWNGSMYLPEQVSSLRGQTIVNAMELVVRDDGSSDDTRKILALDHGIRATAIFGENIGVIRSFFELLAYAKTVDADYVAFCDQDDVWLPNKLARAVASLYSVGSTPSLYCSGAFLVDRNLIPIGVMNHGTGTDLNSLLVRNVATGCTCVMNRFLLEKIRIPESTSSVLMHDWWVAIIASVFGKVIYDDTPSILYRQHGGNQVGAPSMSVRIARKIRSLRAGSRGRVEQARALLDCLCDVPTHKQESLKIFIESSSTLLGRLRWVISRHGPKVPMWRRLVFVLWS